MNQKLKEKIQEALSSVLPITIIVLILSTLLVPLSVGTVVMFLVGAVLLIVGMGFFTLGADIAMMPMGEGIGNQFTKINKLWLVMGLTFIMGFIITIAEPDLDVLAKQVSAIPDQVLIYTVACGVGIFLVFSLLRIVFQIGLAKMLIIFYLIVFTVSIFVPNNFVSVAFDSGGVTTGPITVPFILALGIGLTSLRSDKESHDNSFGLVALCSIGPILAVMILGILYDPQSAIYDPVVIPHVETMQDVFKQFAIELPLFAKEVLMALSPILIFFILFQLITKHFPKKRLLKVFIGILYTFIGLVLFLTGVNVGFIPVGTMLGSELAASSYRWILIPLGMLVGYFIVSAEPAIHVLNKQVEDVSAGTISAKAMNRSLAIGVAVSVGLSMVRVLTGISIYWFLIPGYSIALLLSFFVPKIFTGIAFDSGGVASGPMTSSFLLPFAMGACEAVGGNILTDAFGIVAMVAMTPLIAIQILGFVYSRKMAQIPVSDDTIEYEDFPALVEDEEVANEF